MPDSYLPREAALRRTGWSRTTLWRRVRNGTVRMTTDPLDLRRRLYSAQDLDRVLGAMSA